MKKYDKPTKYMTVANEIIAEIVAGKYKAGDKLYSRSAIMKKFSVGEVTAVRVQNYLEAGGLVRKAARSGMYVCYDSDSFSVKLERANSEPPERLIEFRNRSHHDKFYEPLYRELERCAERHGFPYKTVTFSEHEVSEYAVNCLADDPEAGYICYSAGSPSLLFSSMILLNGNVKSVLIDGIMPQTDCMLIDSFTGMKQLIDHVYSQGCKKVIFAKNFCRSLGGIHNEERELASRLHCHYLGIPFQTIDSGNYDELLEVVQCVKERTAVLFPQDDAAYTLKRLLGKARPDILITGFDDYCSTEKNDHTIPSIRWDHKAMAEAVFDLMQEGCTRIRKIKRIPGILVNCD